MDVNHEWLRIAAHVERHYSTWRAPYDRIILPPSAAYREPPPNPNRLARFLIGQAMGRAIMVATG